MWFTMTMMEISTNKLFFIEKIAKPAEPVNGQDERHIELHPKSWTRKSTKGVQKSMGKELFSEELKLAVVQYVLEGHTRKEASEKFCVSCTPIEKWVNLYKLHGAKGLLSRNLVGRQKGFDGEFRLKVLQYKQEHHLAHALSDKKPLTDAMPDCLHHNSQGTNRCHASRVRGFGRR